jgi:iron complex transport system ATP-binding protein
MIRCNNLTADLNSNPIINRVSFDIHKGEIVGIIGPNGAGKTTLLRAILGQIDAYSGDISVDGVSINKLGLKTLAKKIAWVSSELNCSFNYTVVDIIKMGRFPYHNGFFDSLLDDNSLINDLLEVTELTHLKDKPFNQLSSGEKQRVQLAKALAQEPSVLLLDEPISHLDLRHQENFLNILKKRNTDDNLTIVMVSHHIDVISRVCNRVLFLKAGEITEDGTSRELLTKPNISNLFDIFYKP